MDFEQEKKIMINQDYSFIIYIQNFEATVGPKDATRKEVIVNVFFSRLYIAHQIIFSELSIVQAGKYIKYQNEIEHSFTNFS